ncbi:MAG: T9SS type A sorting domain-containing protein [Bacteroidales bacterium]|jgi:hypothetical protein|nr:T9SS type A sorting domain-containing protein [Bacteroidales bacterium]
MKRIFLILGMCAAMTSLSAQNIRYVTQNGAGSKTGISWNDASDDIQKMINDLEQLKGGQVWVAKGTYVPVDHYGGKENLELIIPSPPATDPQYDVLPFPFDQQREVSFVLKKNVEVYGGFIGNENKLSERDWEKYITTLNGQGIVYHVIISVGDVGSACLDGFHITGGHGITEQPLPLGGDLYYTCFGNCSLWGSNLMMSNTAGGGISLLYSSPRLANLVIHDNKVSSYGGAIAMRHSSSELSNIEIHNNDAYRHGGGMFINVSEPVLDNMNIHDNTSYYGGGVYDEVTKTLYRNVIIANNTAYDYGGGIHMAVSESILVNVLIEDNELTGVGGYGGGIYNDRSYTTMINMTMVNNKTSSNKYSGLYNYSYPVKMYNSIVYANNDVNSVDETALIAQSTFDRCLIQNRHPSGNNLDGNTVFPDFVNPNNDYHLLPNSQCVDFGEQSYVNPYTQIDLDGNPRVRNGNVDLGVYEHQWERFGTYMNGEGQKSLAGNNSQMETPWEEMTLSMYPNPVYSGDQINIYLGKGSFEYNKQVEVKLFSIEGKLIYSKVYPNGNVRTTLPELTPGMYFFTLQTEDGTLYNQKLVINK